MIKNIYSLIESFGLSVQQRALHIHFSNEILNTQVFIQRIEGEHRINQGLRAELICLLMRDEIISAFFCDNYLATHISNDAKLFHFNSY